MIPNDVSVYEAWNKHDEAFLSCLHLRRFSGVKKVQ